MTFEKEDCVAWLPLLESIARYGKVLMTNGRLLAVEDSNRDQIDPYFNTTMIFGDKEYAILKQDVFVAHNLLVVRGNRSVVDPAYFYRPITEDMDTSRYAYDDIESESVCEVCGKPLMLKPIQGIYRIKDTKENRARYGDFVINHKLNIGRFCSFECNNVRDLGQDTEAALQLCKQIYESEDNLNACS